MTTITTQTTVEITVDPEVLANAFCEMDSNEQAMFFNYVAMKTSTWSSTAFPIQMMEAFKSKSISPAGKGIMKEIAEATILD